MTVSMGIRHLDTGECEMVPVTTTDIFEAIWLPACQQLGLQYVSHFHDGALGTGVPRECVADIVDELHRLRLWAAERYEMQFIIQRIDLVLGAFESNSSSACEYDFG